MYETIKYFAFGHRLALTNSLDHSGLMAVWSEPIPSINADMGQLDPDDPLDMDEGMMDDDMTHLYCSTTECPY